MASQEPVDPLVGQQIDRYVIQDVLGRGGMGVVYKAFDTGLDRTVAIKTITAHLAQNAQFIRRFWTEAKAMAKLESPHIVNVYDVQNTSHGLWIFMEYVEGRSLGERIKEDGPLTWQEALPVMKQALYGFSYAHENDVLHRDVKPSNVMVTPRGTVKIMDFGLAKVHTGESTMTVGMGGTLYYMSPEQVKGLAHVDARSDLFSWGMSCYEMLAGDIPFNRSESQFSIMNAIITGEYQKALAFPPSVPEGLKAIITKAIAIEPDDRYQTADEMLAALEAFEQESSVRSVAGVGTVGAAASAAPSKKKPRQKALPTALADEPPALPPPRTSRLPLVLGVVGVLALLAGAWWMWGDALLRHLNSDMADHDRRITTEPAGARVMVNGVWIGETPVEVPLELVDFAEQTMLVHVQHPGYRNLSTRTAAGSLPLHFALEPVGRLTLSVQPPEADVLLDGEPLARDERSDVEVDVGAHQLVVSHPGFATVEQTLEVQQGVMHPVEVRLPPEPGTAEVVQNRDPVQDEQQQQDQQGQQGQQPPPLRPATLEVIARPWGDIYIDGQRHREGWDRLFSIQLPPGPHTVRLVHPQLGTFEETITLTPGETLRLDKNLSDL